MRSGLMARYRRLRLEPWWRSAALSEDRLVLEVMPHFQAGGDPSETMRILDHDPGPPLDVAAKDPA